MTRYLHDVLVGGPCAGEKLPDDLESAYARHTWCATQYVNDDPGTRKLKLHYYSQVRYILKSSVGQLELLFFLSNTESHGDDWTDVICQGAPDLVTFVLESLHRLRDRKPSRDAMKC